MNHPDLSEARPVPIVSEPIIEEAAEDPNFHLARLEVSSTDHFVFCYSQKTDALDRQWKLLELYHHCKHDGATFITNCTHMINMVMGSGMLYNLRVNLEHIVDSAHKVRMTVKPHHPLDWNDE